MATTGDKSIFATELDANDSTNQEGELGVLRRSTDGITYRYVQIGTGGCTTGQALHEVTAGTDTILKIVPAQAAEVPVAAFAQSTITANYYGWVIWQGPVANAICADASMAAGARLRNAQVGLVAGRVSGTGANQQTSFARTAAGSTGATFKCVIRN